jgi:diapolycopene oxygenase
MERDRMRGGLSHHFRERAAVIGAGIGGLSAAVSLAAAGFAVTLFEKQADTGGKAGTLTINGYRFDTGPSLLTLPGVFDSLFARAGRRREDYIEFIPLSPLTRYWFSDGTRITSDLQQKFIPRLTETFQVTRKEAERYFSYSKRIYDLTHHIFLEQSLHRVSTYTSWKTLSSLLRLFSIDPLRTMDRANRSFFRDPRMVQLLNRYATYNGSSPYRAPATLNNIAYVEHGIGGYGVADGIYGITRGLTRLAEDMGVEVKTGTPVTSIRTDSSGRVCGVAAEEKEHPFAVVVSDVDVLTLYETLLNDPEEPLARRYRRLPPSSSGLVYYWGIKKSFDELGVHNIFFSADYPREFSQIHELGKVPDDPTVYINITSKLTPSDAPEGCENWFVLINAPPHDGRDWSEDLKHTREKVLTRLSRELKVQVEDLIVAEDTLTPRGIEEDTGSWRGSLYGISSNTLTAAFLRHPNFSKRHRGLYVCGGSAHPGGGMPLVTLSGMITADIIQAERRGR